MARGFTFLEIMFVVAIIGILLSIAIPRFTGKAQRAKIRAAKFQIAQFKTVLGAYEMDVGSFPTTAQGLKALVERPPDVPEEDWHGKYIDSIPKDPWHQEYIYRSPGEHNPDYDLFSKGPDRQEGTEDDITNWEEEES
ncbi:type II secretion system major pseudopilin GspG [Candidatus Sumerlaeota bacterium]|nr:type II secretion system major pseudopilin GspG [Candidatus Sumerlaeota bacterium]